MAIHIPAKILVGKILNGTTNISTYWSGGTYDGAPLSYTATFQIDNVSAGYPTYANNPALYNAYDIEIGWQFLFPNGAWYDIIDKTVNNDNEIILEIRDTDLRILTNDSLNDPPFNGPSENVYGVLCPVVNGVAQLANLSKFAGAFPTDSYWVDDMQAEATNYIVANGGGGSGTNGTSGTSGSSGTSGESGTSGSSGTSGESGTSGSSGSDGSSGTSGDSLFISGAGFYYTTNDIQISGSLVVSDYVETSLLRGTGSLFLQPDKTDERLFQIYNTAAPSGSTDIHFKGNADFNYFGDDINYLKIDDSAQTVSIVGVNGLFVSGNIYQTGSLYVDGTLTAREIHTSYVTSSVLYQSGSTKFGDTQDDTHVFTGSLITTGSLTINGDLTVNGTSILKAIDNRESLIVSGAMNIVSNNVNASVVSASLAFESVKAIEQIINITTMDLGYF